MPPGAKYVGRGSRWGNPFKVGTDGDAVECVRKYAEWLTPYSHRGPNSTMEHFLLSQANIEAIRADLAGCDLACWCAVGQPCHADLLLEIASG